MSLATLLNINIVTEYPLWLGVLCILLGAAYAFVLYRREDKLKEVSLRVVRLMGMLRFILVSLLAFLLLSPLVKTLFNKVEKPVIVIAQDNTTSILLNKDSTFYQNQYLKNLERLKVQLGENYEVKSYTFGSELVEGNKIDYSKKITDLSRVLEELSNKFYSRNVGALILATDGLFNQGANPVFSKGIEFPIYTIALGDTSAQRDIVLKEVIHNKLTFLGNKFPLEIEINAKECKGKSTTLSIVHNNKKIVEKSYDIIEEDFSVSENLLLEANKIGVQHYRVTLSTVKNEISVINNVEDIYIEVLDGRQNVLVIANAPHPDVKAIKLSIESNENYKVTTLLSDEFDGNIKPYSLIVLHQIDEMDASLQKVLSSNVSVLYILGGQSNIKRFNQLNSGLNIANTRNKFNEILPSVADNFPLFTISENAANMINDMPPVIGSFGSYQLTSEGYVLLNQKIGSVVTENPLLVFFQENDKKVGVLAAEGIWRWRMQDYLRNGNHDNFNELINKAVQFLSVKEDKSKFRIITDNNYYENEEILLNGELYNESYELVNNPEIKISFTEENGANYNFVFNRTSTAYILNAGILPAGFYTYKARVSFGAKDYTALGKFQVKPLLLESNNTVADHQLLQNIAEKFGGKLYNSNELGRIPKEINSNDNIASVIYEENDIMEIINLKWIFFVLLSLLSLEWFLRKRNGAY
jgi:hypothetical protein